MANCTELPDRDLNASFWEIFDGQPRNHANFEHNISVYFEFHAHLFCLHQDPFVWFPELGLGISQHIASAAVSLLVNLTVITLSVFSEHLKDDFRFFFANLALANYCSA